jgi:hypothetical protein
MKEIIVVVIKSMLIFVSIAIGCAAGCAVLISLHQCHRESMRAEALPITMAQAAPIIEAIERYCKEHDTPPPDLNVLIPHYLRQLPEAGPIAEDGWHYSPQTYEDSGGWTLLVRVRDEYSPNLVGFGDSFVYHSSGNYPRGAYGGMLMPFGRWGYYVE